MGIQPWVTVEPPDYRGLRKIVLDSETVGSAWSFREMRQLLRRLGYSETIDWEDPSSIYWRGGDSKTWPDHPRRRHAIIVLMIAGMLGSVALHLFIGWPDAFDGLTFAQRIVGAMFISAGALQGAAIFAIFDYWGKRHSKLSGVVVLIGALIALGTNSLLLFMWLEEREFIAYLVVFILLGIWSLWATFLLIREKPWERVRNPNRIAVGVIATALLTAVSLAYSTMYQPTAAPVHLLLKVEFGKPQESPDPKYLHIPLRLYVKNTGGIAVYVINDDYTVAGSSVKYAADGEGLKRWKTATEENPGYVAEAERYIRNNEETVVNSGHFYGPGGWFEVGEEYADETVVRLPKDSKFDTLEARLTIVIMRKDRGKINEEFSTPRLSWKEYEGSYYCPRDECREYGEYVAYRGRVRHNNNMINVTRKPRYVTAFWNPELGNNDFISSFNPKRKTQAVFDEALAEKGAEEEMERESARYGVGVVFTYSEIPIKAFLDRSGA
ncbi:Yip1 family protein [Streptomyces sp. ID05-47C]|uniref:Yip1 family protein n=1 Tax=Streptomyces sp. ID05-47C TaxID=3028665 RepID=UPI0029A3F456|nr:Yip1 family protein [Streptomyces sp. ID05-47C]MDX3570966.1 Yip1 family protein [Streptomyces sp. ID05-47C]